MSVTLTASPQKTINGISSNVNAGRAQLPFTFLATDIENTNYKVNIRVVDSSNNPLIETIFKYSPRPDGTLFVDLGTIITELQEEIVVLAEPFHIEYWESYEGFEGAHTFSQGYLSIYAEKQLLSEGGSNMWEYLLNNFESKILTLFENPLYWEGFYRKFSVIVDDDFENRTGQSSFSVQQRDFDINLDQIGSKNTFSFSATPQRVQIIDLVQSTSPYTSAQIEGLSERKTFKKQSVCENPVMVQWLNSVGGLEQHLFQIDQVIERESEKGVQSEISIDQDIESVFRTKLRIAQKWTQSALLFTEGLTQDQFRALTEIKQSSSVVIWLNNDGSNFVGVTVRGNLKTQYHTQDTYFDFQIELEMPNNFDIRNAIDYKLPTFEKLIDSDQADLIDSDNEILQG